MELEEVIRMAKEAGVIPVNRAHLGMEPIWWSVTIEDIERFAALVAAAERERCIHVCDKKAATKNPPYKSYEDTYMDGWLDASNECGWGIRALNP